MRSKLAALAILACLRPALAEEPVTITFTKDLPLTEFLDGAALTIGTPILYDPTGQRFQRGQTMGADMKVVVPKGKELDLIRSILAFYEVTLVQVGPKGYEVFVATDTRSTNMLVKNKATNVPFEALANYEGSDGLYIVTSIPVKHVENLTILRTALSTMVTPSGIGRVHEVPGVNRLIVMDYAPTVVAMARLIKEMDVEPEPVVTKTIVLQHAHAAPLAATLKELFVSEPPRPDPRQQGIGRASDGPRIAAYEPRNAIVVLATESDLGRIREVISQLDVAPAE